MNKRRSLGLLTVVVSWSAVLWIACGGPSQPAQPSGLEVQDSDPSPSHDLNDDTRTPYPGAIELASVVPSGSGGWGGSVGSPNSTPPNVPRIAGTGGSGGSDGAAGIAGALPHR